MTWVGSIQSIGLVDTVEKNPNGSMIKTRSNKIFISVEVFDFASFSTEKFYTDESNIKTAIDPSSPLSSKLMSLKRGDLVIFSGSFFPHKRFCLNASVGNEKEFMFKPKFEFKFSNIELISP